MENRSKEAVRPINWSNRPLSYVMRTDDWDEVRLIIMTIIAILRITLRHLLMQFLVGSFRTVAGVIQQVLHLGNFQSYPTSILLLSVRTMTAVLC